jgi:hypothetical protein
MSPGLVPNDAIPEVTNWANIVHVDASGYESRGRRTEVIQSLAVYAAQGKKVIVDFGGFFYNSLAANQPLTSQIPNLMNWHVDLWPLRDAIHAIQILDEPRNWMDRAPYNQTLSGEDISDRDPFSKSRYLQKDAYALVRSFFADFQKPIISHFDNANDMGPDFPIVVVNLYARRNKIERMMNEFYWKAQSQGQKLWVTGRAFSARGRNGECTFHCRGQEVLLGDAEETENAIKAYGAEVVLWFIYQGYETDLEVTTGTKDNPELQARHADFFQDFILPNHQKVAAARLADRAQDEEAIYVLRTSANDRGRKVSADAAKAFLDQSDVEIVPVAKTRARVSPSWKR